MSFHSSRIIFANFKKHFHNQTFSMEGIHGKDVYTASGSFNNYWCVLAGAISYFHYLLRQPSLQNLLTIAYPTIPYGIMADIWVVCLPRFRLERLVKRQLYQQRMKTMSKRRTLLLHPWLKSMIYQWSNDQSWIFQLCHQAHDNKVELVYCPSQLETKWWPRSNLNLKRKCGGEKTNF